ncbi:hypothetical protein [Candidatus Parabeggiatoa sp. HSG14]|uniref:hypothetical protein n=1 Tax=Candidatus Parabeggiatoa sp. HSG14 TaxID=3055593 RepID=UPI0025A8AD52|nr:hypothetical protein [Thiotrichales bacterium HSG14]
MDIFESGEISIILEILLLVLKEIDVSLSQIIQNLNTKNSQEFPRNIYAKQYGTGINVYFIYSKHEAVYFLDGATVTEFNQVIKELRNGLAKLASKNDQLSEALKTEAVARAFIKAVKLWPYANPSDIWWFIIYRVYCDPFNHPAKYSRLSFEQSWKRTGGWALEEILIRHYGPSLKKTGINLFIASTNERVRFLKQVNISDRLEADKADVLLTGTINGEDNLVMYPQFGQWIAKVYLQRNLLIKENLGYQRMIEMINGVPKEKTLKMMSIFLLAFFTTKTPFPLLTLFSQN